MSRTALGVAVGVAGSTAYLRPDLLIEWARTARPVTDTRELEHLSKLVEQLTREVQGSRQQPSQPITIISSDTNPRHLTYALIAAAGASGLLYLTFLSRGWRFSDLMYVSRRTFKQGVAGLTAGLDALNARLQDAKARLLARIAEVSKKQDQAAALQAAIQDDLRLVAGDVDSIRSQVGDIHAAVFDMDGAIADMSADQRHSLLGIYILCRAVNELTEGSSIPSKTELLEFTRSPMWTRMRPHDGVVGGLENILPHAGSSVGATVAHNGVGGRTAVEAAAMPAVTVTVPPPLHAMPEDPIPRRHHRHFSDGSHVQQQQQQQQQYYYEQQRRPENATSLSYDRGRGEHRREEYSMPHSRDIRQQNLVDSLYSTRHNSTSSSGGSGRGHHL